MTQTPDRIWINTTYIDSRSTTPVLPRNIGTSEQSLSLADDVQYLLATPLRVAAPDMLEALEQLVIEYDEVDLVCAEPAPLTAAVLAARAAIAKATGKPK